MLLTRPTNSVAISFKIGPQFETYYVSSSNQHVSVLANTATKQSKSQCNSSYVRTREQPTNQIQGLLQYLNSHTTPSGTVQIHDYVVQIMRRVAGVTEPLSAIDCVCDQTTHTHTQVLQRQQNAKQ